MSVPFSRLSQRWRCCSAGRTFPGLGDAAMLPPGPRSSRRGSLSSVPRCCHPWLGDRPSGTCPGRASGGGSVVAELPSLQRSSGPVSSRDAAGAAPASRGLERAQPAEIWRIWGSGDSPEVAATSFCHLPVPPGLEELGEASFLVPWLGWILLGFSSGRFLHPWGITATPCPKGAPPLLSFASLGS